PPAPRSRPPQPLRPCHRPYAGPRPRCQAPLPLAGCCSPPSPISLRSCRATTARAYRREVREGAPAEGAPFSDQRNVPSLGALGAILDLVLNSRSLGEGLEALGLDRAEVDEHVLAAVGRGDEPVALGVVEPLDSSGCHAETPPS